jgi:hypothetical protein
MHQPDLVNSLRVLAGLLCVLAAGVPARAQNGVTTLVRMPRVTAMGGAGVGLADDEYALFLNPAGLAGQNTRRFRVLGAGAEATVDSILNLSSSISGLSNFTPSNLNTLMGKEVFVRSSVVPMIQLPGFALTYFGDVQGAIEQYNQANPSFKLGSMITHGVQAGMGWSWKSGRRAKDELRYGVSGKMLWRRGGYYDSVSTLQLASQGKSYINSLMGEFGTGFGADLGLQYVNHMNAKEELLAGASLTDVGGIRFSSANAQRIEMNPSIGIAYKRNADFMRFRLAFDLRNLDQAISFANKTHFGAEASLRILDLQLGLNQLNPTYGVAFDLWVLRVTAVSFSEELGVRNHQLTSRRYMLQVDLNLPI